MNVLVLWQEVKKRIPVAKINVVNSLLISSFIYVPDADVYRIKIQ
jgi:hypothetical protein